MLVTFNMEKIMLGAWKDLGRVASLVTKVQYTYFTSSHSVLTTFSQLRLFRSILRGLRPPPRDVTGNRICVAPGVTSVPPPAPRFPLKEGVSPRGPENRPTLTVR